VIQTINQTVITLNGQPVPIQIANNQGYLAASKTTATVNVGVSTTLEPGSITTGFTAMFLPRIVNGKVILGMTITHSTNNGFGEITSNGSTIQLPNIDSNVFQQSVSLTPGDELMLTGLQRDDNSLNKSGVGNPDNFWLGGGIGNNTSRQLVAIVVTARVL
jgi:type IVB pilus formation R64 PilN family outer membrane protein